MGAADAITGRRAARWSAAVVLLAWLVATALVIQTNSFPASRAAQDQDNYHLQAVRTFAAELPRVDLRDYRSATTPGYHLALAETARAVSDDLRVLRVAGAAFTAGLLVTLAGCTARFMRGPAPGAIVMPLACSLYVFSAGAWLLPDNAGWWGVLAVIAIALLRTPTGAAILVAGGVLLALVLCRQIHLWAAGVVWLWAFLGGPEESPDMRARLRRLGFALAATAPAFGAVAWFWSLWGGPVPPLFQGGTFDPIVGKLSPKNTGPNPATPAFLFMLFGAYGVFFMPYLLTGLRRVRGGVSSAAALVTAGMLLGAVLALVPETSFNPDAGRYTGFWAIVARTPVVHGRSLFLLGGSVVGGAVIGLCGAGLRRRDAWLVLAAVLGFAAAQTTAFAAWQRYMEPFVLIVLALVAVAASVRPAPLPAGDAPVGAPGAAPATWRGIPRTALAAAGPALLGLLLGAITLTSLRE